MRCNFRKLFLIGSLAFILFPLFSFPNTALADDPVFCCLQKKDSAWEASGQQFADNATCNAQCPGIGSQKGGTAVYPYFGCYIKGCPVDQKTAASAQNRISIGNVCFTPAECTGSPYYGAPSSKPVPECVGFGKASYYCYAKMKPYNLQVHIGTTKTIKSIEQYIATIYAYLIRISGVFAGIMIVYAGLKWMLAAGDPGKITDAKTKIFDALIGLILVVGAYTILNTINPALLQLSLTPIKLIRKEAIDTEPLAECDVLNDCRINLSYAVCADLGLGAGGNVTRALATQCEDKTADEVGIAKKGKCVVAENEICNITAYTCFNWFRAFGGDTNSTTFNATLACAQGTTCQVVGDFTEGNKTFKDVKVSKCLKTTAGSPCHFNSECPQGLTCLHPASPALDPLCGALSAVPHDLEEGQPCVYDESCKNKKCASDTNTCRSNRTLPEGAACTMGIDCQSGICSSKTSKCLRLGGNQVGEECKIDTDCGRCEGLINPSGPPNCNQTRACFNQDKCYTLGSFDIGTRCEGRREWCKPGLNCIKSLRNSCIYYTCREGSQVCP